MGKGSGEAGLIARQARKSLHDCPRQERLLHAPTALMRAHTWAPSVLSAVCTRHNCSGVMSSWQDLPNFSTVGRKAGGGAWRGSAGA